jgi:hypothetical protein
VLDRHRFTSWFLHQLGAEPWASYLTSQNSSFWEAEMGKIGWGSRTAGAKKYLLRPPHPSPSYSGGIGGRITV